MDDVAILEKAEEVRRTLTGEFEQIRTLVNQHEVVFGVWPTGKMIVKGEPLLRFITQTGMPEELTWTAIPCASEDHALALKEWGYSR